MNKNLKNVATTLLVLMAIGISGCTKYIDQPYAVDIDVPVSSTRPFQAFPQLPPKRANGTRDMCLIHQYRVKIEYLLCSEYHRKNNLIHNITDGRQGFSIPKECEAINSGVMKKYHLACDSEVFNTGVQE